MPAKPAPADPAAIAAGLSRAGDDLLCEGVSLTSLANAAGTPLYFYSHAVLLERAAALREGAPDALLAYAVKANGNAELIRLLGEAGLGADVTSAGELFLARYAGIPPDRLVFSGVGKSAAEIEAAVRAGIHALHVESAAEMDQIGLTAARLETVTRVAVRVNPDVATDTHPYIKTGRRDDKFGVDPATALRLLHEARRHRWLEPVGVGAHIGSQIRELEPYNTAVTRLLALAGEARSDGIALTYVDGGGGWGLDYERGDNPPATLREWATAVAGPIAAAGYRPVLEPGRALIGPSGFLLTRVLGVKQQGNTRFVIVDAGMNDLIRPALYRAHHPIWPVSRAAGPHTPADVVGPLCESGDFLARARPLPPFEPGDLLVVGLAGAYGYAMSSNYNGRPRPAEALITGDRYQTIRRRQRLNALI